MYKLTYSLLKSLTLDVDKHKHKLKADVTFLFRHIILGGDQLKMELAYCVRLSGSIVGM